MNKLVWVSAAHVIESIDRYSKNQQLIEAVWIDRFDSKEVPILPSTKKRFSVISFEDQGHDFGALLIPIIDIEHIKNNPNIRPFKVRTKGEELLSNPEGYIFVGFPWEKIEISSVRVSKKQEKVTLKTELITLPILRMGPPKLENPEQHWDDQDAFYGEVLPYFGEEKVAFTDYKGMSGAPILSIKNSESGILFVMEGIFSSFIENKRWIRAEPINLVIEKIEAWIKDQKE